MTTPSTRNQDVHAGHLFPRRQRPAGLHLRPPHLAHRRCRTHQPGLRPHLHHPECRVHEPNLRQSHRPGQGRLPRLRAPLGGRRHLGRSPQPRTALGGRSRSVRHTGRLVRLHHNREADVLTVGADYQLASYANYRETGETSPGNDATATAVGFYAQEEFQLDALILRAGARYNIISHDIDLLQGLPRTRPAIPGTRSCTAPERATTRATTSRCSPT